MKKIPFMLIVFFVLLNNVPVVEVSATEEVSQVDEEIYENGIAQIVRPGIAAIGPNIVPTNNFVNGTIKNSKIINGIALKILTEISNILKMNACGHKPSF